MECGHEREVMCVTGASVSVDGQGAQHRVIT